MIAERPGSVTTLFTVGEALAVFLADDGRPLAESTGFRRVVAGSESNVAAGFVRLGHRARLVTRVGRDPLGDAVAASLASWGIDAVALRSDLPTGTLVRGPGTDRGAESVHLRTASAATELSPADVDRAWLPDSGVVFVTGITAVRSPSARAAVERAVARGRDAGALIVVDPNLRPRVASAERFGEALAPLRGVVDLAIGDLDELAILSGTSREAAPRALIDSGCRIVVVKRGARGAVAHDGTAEYEVASHATDIVDTVGAGDAFAAGLIAGLVEGESIRDALQLASAVAAGVIATVGDVEGFPWRGELRRREETP